MLTFRATDSHTSKMHPLPPHNLISLQTTAKLSVSKCWIQMEPGGNNLKGQMSGKQEKTLAAVERHLEALKVWLN